MDKRVRMKAVYIIESQPPTLGELYSLYRIVDNFDHIFLCIQNAPMVTPVPAAMAIWETLIKPYQDKVTLCIGDKDFVSVSKIPEKYEDCKILTISQPIFTHLQSLNINVGLVPRLPGYESIFLRAAYRQSKALEWIRTHTRLSKR